MPKSDDGENESKRHQRPPNAQSDYHHRSGDQFYEGNDNTHCPKRPHGQKGVPERQKVFASVVKWSKLKDFHHSSHEENQSQNQTRKQNRPRAIDVNSCLGQCFVPYVPFCGFTLIQDQS